MNSPFSRLRQAVRFAAVLAPCLLILLSCGKKEESNQDAAPATGKKWKLSMLKFEDIQQTDEAEKGFRAGLRDAGFEEGVDYELHVRSAQGDIPTILNLIDAVNNDGTDIMLSMQTSTLSTAVQRGTKIPIVFMVVANPFVVTNVGENDTLKMHNVTGVYTKTTFEQMMSYIKQVMPNVKRLGTLYNTSELNATYYKYQLFAAAEKQGIFVETFGVSSKADIPQATQALVSKNLDAICQIEDNLTSATFPAIVQVARQKKLPVFSFVESQIEQGSVMVFAPDYTEAAKDAAAKAARIMKGESPRSIPLSRINKFTFMVNTKAASEAGLTIPKPVLDAADKVLP